MKTSKTADVVTWLEGKVSYAQGRIDEFSKNMESTSPAHAFEWSLDAFEAAAWLSIGKLFLQGFKANPDASINVVMAHAESGMLNKAKYPSRSSSPTATLMHACEGAVYAELYEWLKSCIPEDK